MKKRTVEKDVPFTMNLPDGRIVFVEVPGKWCRRDVSGEIVFKPEAVRLLDHVHVMAGKVPATPTAGYIRTLRQALGLTQQQFGERVGVDKMTVWRWEKKQFKPDRSRIKAMESLRRETSRKGVLLAG